MTKRRIYTKKFWLDTAERVIGTAAAAALSAMAGADLFGIDPKAVVGLTLGAAVFTTLKCVTAATIGEKGTAALLPSSTGETNGS